jgi:LuxR family maltose regulon positive regulatory protein
VLGLLEGLIERLPAQWSVLLSSRVLPALPLARWRAAGELVLFGQDQLAFSADEAARSGRRPKARRPALPELFQRTRGWPAGLRLCLLARAPQRAGSRAGAGP